MTLVRGEIEPGLHPAIARLSRGLAHAEMRRNGTLIGAMLVSEGKADGLLCGTVGSYPTHLRYLEEVIGLKQGAHKFAAMNLLQLPRHTLFIATLMCSSIQLPTKLRK
jgi:phosphotransacetylase